MEPIHEEHFSEAELLFHDDFNTNDDSQSEDVDYAESPADAHGEERPGEPDVNSTKSSLTVTELDAGSEQPTDAAEVSGDHLAAFRPIATSMPVMSGHVRLGSSVPVSIPPMNRWKKPEAAKDSPTTQYAPATFVPPHQLSQVNEFMFSFTGESPSVAIKRDRLRVRNAILKSTGFLEPGVESVNNIGLQERNRLQVAAGGLSQALQQQSNTVSTLAAAVETS